MIIFGLRFFVLPVEAHETFFQTQWNRFPVNIDYPIFTLTHTIALKNTLGSDYNYNHTEFGVQKRFWLSAFGYTDFIIKAGKVWNKVPFPLLILPNANLSYTIQPEAYSLINAMVFGISYDWMRICPNYSVNSIDVRGLHGN